jgi:hypothetical protein
VVVGGGGQPKLLCKIDVGDWIVQDACQCLNESTDHRFPSLFRPFVAAAVAPEKSDEATEASGKEKSGQQEAEEVKPFACVRPGGECTFYV